MGITAVVTMATREVLVQDCSGSGRRVEEEPNASAATCPVCGRAIPVDPQETDDGLVFVAAPHERAVATG
ncbi:hypothetical protein [Mycobacterium sp. SMC-4]|uniref:hypothetical protein n=1 Tax=Mycobacterium sp. SMC-4 TaxID=2857059 RepID=UPI0021B4751D|nr:hypothetical protein [Mycobacterium sp. SMC-4]UXA21071.1 hypothetical protein KXD98_10915 [Mycobacterium sp. SMC-4]